MNTGRFSQYSVTFTLIAGVTMEAVAMHDPHWHIETNEPQGAIVFRNAPVMVTSSTNITTSTGSLGFG